MFNLQHIITLTVLGIILTLIIIFSKKIKDDSKEDKIVRYVVATSLLLFEIGYYIFWISKGRTDLEMIPFTGFCATTNILTITYLYTNNKKLANITIYYALTGSFFSLIFVSISNSFPHFRFIHYFHNHFMFMAVAVYCYIVGKIQITRKNFNRSALYLVIYSVIILIFDTILKENWFFFRESPIKEISDFLGPILYPPLWMVTIYILINGWYFLFKFIDSKRINNIVIE